MYKWKDIKLELNLNEHMVYLLEAMCSRVDTSLDKLNFEKIDGKYEFPYKDYEWTPEKQKEFSTWAVDYLYDNSKARKAVTTCGRNKSCLRLAIGMFLLQWGWTFKMEGEENG
jgi:hypothetical protein